MRLESLPKRKGRRTERRLIFVYTTTPAWRRRAFLNSVERGWSGVVLDFGAGLIVVYKTLEFETLTLSGREVG